MLGKMSDEPTATKRGRGKAAEKVEKAEKPEPKKRPKKEVAKAEGGDEDGAPQVKRGRGRPKGSTKKKTPGAKPKKGGGIPNIYFHLLNNLF